MQVGTWKKIADLGSGAFGVVSLWQNTENEDSVAIKMCKFKTDTSLTSRQKERWNNEVDMLKIINHPNIIKYKTIPPDLQNYLQKNSVTSMPLLPMEYCRKGNLRHVLSKSSNLCGLPENEVRCILEDISSGLQHLHNLKITHRDVKPDNIVLQHCEEREMKTIYKIIDLGYAKELGDSTVSFVGTLHYLAPEIFNAEDYDHSVDFWSMGILTFEIICGTLPFLAHLTPFERFARIKSKHPDDICIYMSYSGQITNSPNLKKENLISTCLKQNLEEWLRHVLAYNQSVRLQNFYDNIKPFNYLQNILKKNIINVFSVSKLEFYSYEITEGTLVGTVKDWICRDTKIPKAELLLFISKDLFNVQDTDELLNKNDYFYVTRKNFLLEKITYNFPKLIREVMKSAVKFKMTYFKGLKSQFIFFITQEQLIAQHFRISFKLYLNYLNHILTKVKHSKNQTSIKVDNLITKIDCYNKMQTDVCNINLKNNKDYEDCVNYAQRLLASVERSINNFAIFDIKIKSVSNRLKVLSNVASEILNIVEQYNIDDLYLQALNLIGKADINISNNQQLISSITKLISEVIKSKEKVTKNKKLVAFTNAVGKIMCHCFNLLDWIDKYNIHNEELLQAFQQNKTIHFDILLKAAKKSKEVPIESLPNVEVPFDKISLHNNLNGEILCLSIENLIQKNQDLRYNFEDALSQSLSCHKNSIDDFKWFENK